MHFTNKTWHWLLQSVKNKSTQIETLSLSGSIHGLFRLKTRGGGDRLAKNSCIAHSPVWLHGNSVACGNWSLLSIFKGRYSPVRNCGPEMVPLELGTITVRWTLVPWGVCGAMNTGDPQFGWTCYWAKFKPPWLNKGGTGHMPTTSTDQSPQHSPALPGVPHPQGLWGNTQLLGSNDTFVLLSDVLRGQRFKS